MTDKLTELKARLAEVDDLENAAAVLEWDQLTYMPPAGSEGRADQIATLQKIAHQKFTDDAVGALLDDLAPQYAGAPLEDDDAALVRAAQRFYRRKTRLSADLVAAMFQATSLGQAVWARARANNDFEAFRPALERILDLKRQVAACFPEAHTPYDALLDEYEPGMQTAQVRAVFDELRAALVPLVRAIAEQPPVPDAVLRLDYDEQKQWDLALSALRLFGYDFDAGRMDRSVHPFCTSFTLRDVRVTSRVRRDYLPTCLMGAMHECGHALYDLGYPQKFYRSLLGHSASLGIHESQSRLWENLVGRSRGFWNYFYPRVQAAFPEQLAGVGVDEFYRALNKVQPSFIRVEADEVTYNLHTLLRFELELDLLDGRLAVKDAPAAWNAKFKDYFGLDIPEDRLGVLQDVHWSAGYIGYFPTYTLGNLISVQFFEKAVADVPAIPAGIQRGQFGGLLQWLRQNVHCHGRRYLPAELVERVTHRPLTAEPYLAYLRRKYGEIYAL